MEIILLVVLILLNGIFAMSEMALVSARKFKLENAKKNGSNGARIALELTDNPTKFLSTVQIGITLIGILLGIYSGESLTKDFVLFLQGIDLLQPYAHTLATLSVVVLVTYFSIVFGELLPKRLGMTFPETVIKILAQPMRILSILTSPFVWLLSASNNFALTLFGISKSAEAKISEEEIKMIIAESVIGGEIQQIEQNIVERVFELGDRKVNSLMTYRSDIVFFSTSDSWEVVREKVNREKHSAYPVSTSNDLDDMIGIVLLKDLFYFSSDQDFDLNTIVRKPIYLKENTFSYKVLETFKTNKLHYGMVVNEYGTVVGMVTMDDVLDALVGNMTEMDQDEHTILQRNETSWLVDGQYLATDFAKYFELSDFVARDYTTVAGFILHQFEHIPDVGEKVIVGAYEIEIMDKDGRRIDKILVTKIS